MNEPKLHHFVPQFHLKRFADAQGRLSVWDKLTKRTFRTGSTTLAAENQFYFHDQLAAAGHDPLTMERQFAQLEADASRITGKLLARIRIGAKSEHLHISEADRATLSLFLATQALRTADTRDLLAAMDASSFISPERARSLHLDLLWDEHLVFSLSDRIQAYIWVFAQNFSNTPYVTSDNPVAFKTGDNRAWIKIGWMSPEVYLTYALAPDVALYGYPDEGRLRSARKFDGCISPVEMTDELVESDNTAHVFLATRHVISPSLEFSWAERFQRETAEGLHAPDQDVSRE